MSSIPPSRPRPSIKRAWKLPSIKRAWKRPSTKQAWTCPSTKRAWTCPSTKRAWTRPCTKKAAIPSFLYKMGVSFLQVLLSRFVSHELVRVLGGSPDKHAPYGVKQVPDADKHVPDGDKHVPDPDKRVTYGDKHVPDGDKYEVKHVPDGEKHAPYGVKHIPDGHKHLMTESTIDAMSGTYAGLVCMDCKLAITAIQHIKSSTTLLDHIYISLHIVCGMAVQRDIISFLLYGRYCKYHRLSSI